MTVTKEVRASRDAGSSAVAILLATVGLTAVKVLLIPTYQSTDFEVHRNWLAITHTLNLSEWYTEATSQWTLDYPPLFAWGEYCIACVISCVYPQMLQVSAEPYYSDMARLVQRASVIVLDAILLGAAYWHCRSCDRGRRWVPFVLLVASPGLMLVDHIHFQYNGVMLGLLVFSMTAISRNQVLLGGGAFALLLNLKHLYLVLAPVYFVLILRGWCWGDQWWRRLAAMGGLVIAITSASFGPFVLLGQTRQIIERLFPFGRGLMHAYWASNAWALYAAADKVLSKVFKAGASKASLTGGLVGTSNFAVLPQVSPVVCMVLVLLAMAPCLVATWLKPDVRSLHRHVAYAGLCGFMLGYHVHEKAALTVIIPLAMGATASRAAAGRFLLLSTVACFSMHPLLYEPAEYPIKMLILSAGFLLAWSALDGYEFPEDSAHEKKTIQGHSSNGPGSRRSTSHRLRPRDESILSPCQKLYLSGLVPVELYCSVGHGYVFGERLPFVPLMLTSLYCSIGFVWVWIHLFRAYVCEIAVGHSIDTTKKAL